MLMDMELLSTRKEKKMCSNAPSLDLDKHNSYQDNLAVAQASRQLLL